MRRRINELDSREPLSLIPLRPPRQQTTRFNQITKYGNKILAGRSCEYQYS
jgi:hypothetical protein